MSRAAPAAAAAVLRSTPSEETSPSIVVTRRRRGIGGTPAERLEKKLQVQFRFGFALFESVLCLHKNAVELFCCHIWPVGGAVVSKNKNKHEQFSPSGAIFNFQNVVSTGTRDRIPP